MKTLIIGGGQGCKALVDLAASAFLKELVLEIICVMDVSDEAPGLRYASERGIKTSNNMLEALSIPGLELVVELTGRDEILKEIYNLLPPGVKIIDHTFTHIFWDLVYAREEQTRRLEEITTLEKIVEKERIFLQTIFDNTPDLIAILDPEKRIIRINSRFMEFLEVPTEEIKGLECQYLFTKMNLGCDCIEGQGHFDDVTKLGEQHTIIRSTEPPDEIHWEITQTPIFNDNNEITMLHFNWHRITEQVMLRRKAESADQRFRSLIYSASDMISLKDLDGRYMLVNPTTAHSFDLEPSDFIGKKPEEILSPEVSRVVSHHDQEIIQKKQTFKYKEVYNIHGKDRQFNTMRFPLTDYNGAVIGTCAIARDVTNENELQSQLVQATKLAALGKLAAGVAHEINNPLTGVLAYAEDLLEETPADDSRHDDLQVIIRETLRCRSIVRNLLDFSRQDKPKFQVSNPNLIIDRSLALVGKLHHFRDIDIKVKKDKDIPKILSDPSQLQQVVINFMMNAAEAMEGKGKIILKTGFDQRMDRCIIEVEDNGPGIPENLIDKIFEPFFSTKGTNGLGLAVSWGIVERHRGTIEIDESETSGAIFRILLPVS
ncbi:MAG: PAS domain-containing protein [Candidatus Electryonea clarkiae]|nr:PAS domain-containing protein [Candidatus Electryonea clarkiae]MDP8285505.1 PAS domain-containing protein [Candidatus Electryonea clarkiae]